MILLLLIVPTVIILGLALDFHIAGRKRSQKTIQAMKQLEWQNLKWQNPELYKKLNKSIFDKLIDLARGEND